MNTFKKIIVLSGFIFACICAEAQHNVENIFRNYGKRKGSTFIDLGKAVLGSHTKISRYKSLIFPADTALVNVIANEIKMSYRETLMESMKDGQFETGYYYVKMPNSSEYAYILFTNKSQLITLVYIFGTFPPDKLNNELNKLKDLFITVNDKQIKL
ncbi:MAG: hypothetical protein LBT48_01910 [Prevotellaceae bacterium]|jgi:hypothetical protein|nr:hypothetical protein [Prevotellaceae bacterium]